jgi:hypothetical protein
LVGKVEEHDKSNRTNKRSKRISKLALVFSAIFAVCLFTAAFYTLTYTIQDERVLFHTPNQASLTKLVNRQHGDQFKYYISIDTLKGMTEDAISYSIGQYETVVKVPPPNNGITHWTRYFSKPALWLAPNDTAVTVYVTVYDPNDEIVIQYKIDTVYTGPSKILEFFEFSDFGTYTLQFENLGDAPVTAVLIPCGGYTIYKKPLSNYGIAGLILLLLYPVLFFISWNWKQKTAKQTDSPKITLPSAANRLV